MYRLIFLVLSACLYGCGGDSTPTGPTSNVSFASSIQPIFNSFCVSCHQTGQISSFLPLTTGVSYSNLVNKTSTQPSGGTLVIPGNSADSVVYKRFEYNRSKSHQDMDR
ncbi:MAG: Cytochrome c protein [Deltaproteobacteria bacterium]|nr:Cytochrome c protein [Deltaproteobacteria bacterium]